MKTDVVVQFDEVSLEAWRVRLDAERGAATDRILAFAKACHEFAEHCERKGTGSVYTEKMQEWFDINQKTASMWRTLGENFQTFAVANARLPPSMETLYLLCNVPVTIIESQVTPKTTRAEARELKQRHRKGKREGWSEVVLKEFPGDWNENERRGVLVNGSEREVLRSALGKDVVPEKGYVKSAEQREAIIARYREVRDEVRRGIDGLHRQGLEGDRSLARRTREEMRKKRNPIFKKMHYPKPNREVDRAALMLEAICDALEKIDRRHLDDGKTMAWGARVRRCVLVLNRFVRRISHEQTAE